LVLAEHASLSSSQKRAKSRGFERVTFFSRIRTIFQEAGGALLLHKLQLRQQASFQAKKELYIENT